LSRSVYVYLEVNVVKTAFTFWLRRQHGAHHCDDDADQLVAGPRHLRYRRRHLDEGGARPPGVQQCHYSYRWSLPTCESSAPPCSSENDGRTRPLLARSATDVQGASKSMGARHCVGRGAGVLDSAGLGWKMK